MNSNPNVPPRSFSELEKTVQELTKLQTESIAHLLDITHTKHQFLLQKKFDELEATMYSGIKKIFKWGRKND